MREDLNWINRNKENIDITNNLGYSNHLDFGMLNKDDKLYYFWDYKRDILICGEENFHKIISQCTRFALVDDLDMILHNRKFVGLIMRNASFYSIFCYYDRTKENFLETKNRDGLNDVEKELLSSLIEEYAKDKPYISSAFIEDLREKVTAQAAHIREELMHEFQTRIENEEDSEAWYTEYAARKELPPFSSCLPRGSSSVLSPTVLPAEDYQI
jgi:hypothetical protein